MSMNVLVTGANRGIGLEFVRQYWEDGWSVIGTCRRPAEADDLRSLQERSNGELVVKELDVTESEQIESIQATLSNNFDGLDLLINNAGIYGDDSDFENLEDTGISNTFDVNCLGAFRMTKALLPLLKSAQGNIVLITSLMGSIEDNRSGGSYPYRISKAALNMLGRTLSEDYRSDGIYVSILHPGWVQTRMGGPNAKISVEDSVSGMRDVIDSLDESMSGEFYAYDGETRPW